MKKRIGQKQQGILLIIAAGFFFSLMTFFVRISGDLPTMQKVFFRNAVAAVIAFVMLVKSKEGFKIQKSSWLWLTLRCVIGTTGIVLNFYAIDRLNIADANILNKLSPFFAMIMSIFVLKEKPNKFEWGCIIVAFTGAVCVVKPSFSMEFLFAMAGLLGGYCAGAAYTFVRKLGTTGERGPIIVFCFSMFSSLVALPFMIVNWVPMTWQQTLYILLSGVSAAGGQLTITAAYTKAPAKEISVFDYTQVLFAAMLGMIFLNQYPDWLSILGYVIIIGSAVAKYIFINKKDKAEE